MSFPKLSFPLAVDFGTNRYWIGDAGPFKYGDAITEFFTNDDLADDTGDGLLLINNLEKYLSALGSHLQPYASEQDIPVENVIYPEDGSTDCAVCFAFHLIEDDIGETVERYTFSCLRDFLYVELGKAIQRGNAPRQCRLCGRWFLHKQGEKSFFCTRTAPGEKRKTCRMIGSRVLFEQKRKTDEAWKLYKRAYKKYYARVRSGSMTREDFNVWAKQAAMQRDNIRKLISDAKNEDEKAALAERLKRELNCL